MAGKGDRIRIVKGRKGRDQTGTIFWIGENKYGDGKRFGVTGDDGETYWVAEDYTEKLDAKDPGFAPADEGETFEKGDRVSWKNGDQSGTGSVIWTGKSKSGPGMRIGVRDDNMEEAVWLNARQAKRLDPSDEPAPGAAANDRVDSWGGGRGNGGGHGGGGGGAASWGEPVADDGYVGGAAPADLGPPPDMPRGGDAAYDDWAADVPDDDGSDIPY